MAVSLRSFFISHSLQSLFFAHNLTPYFCCLQLAASTRFDRHSRCQCYVNVLGMYNVTSAAEAVSSYSCSGWPDVRQADASRLGRSNPMHSY